MTDIKISFHDGVPWIVYHRLEKNPSNQNKKKVWPRFYWHCTCQGNGQHGAVDVRYDARESWFGHECIITEKSALILQLEKGGKRSRDDRMRESLSIPLVSSKTHITCLMKSWMRFQTIHDLSFRTAISSEFYSLAHQLIKLGQENPLLSPKLMFPWISRRNYGNRLSNFAKDITKMNLELYQGHSVGVIFDSSKLFGKHFLLVYICNSQIRKPTFLTIETNIMKQKDYAKIAARIVKVLQQQQITVTSFCTDGLPVQVNALNGTYRGLYFFFFLVCFNYFLFKDLNQFLQTS
jgi:hypothetical protein